MCLQNQDMAKKSLLPSMSKFEEDMDKCARWANEIENQFDALVKCASEVNLAMADKLGKSWTTYLSPGPTELTRVSQRARPKNIPRSKSKRSRPSLPRRSRTMSSPSSRLEWKMRSLSLRNPASSIKRLHPKAVRNSL